MLTSSHLLTLCSILAQNNPDPGGAAAAGAGVFVLLFSCCMFIGVFLLLGFWIWMIVDCATRDFPGENDKIVWILVVVLCNWIGALIYFFVGRPKGKRR